VGEDAKQAFLGLGLGRAGAQGRPEQALVAADGALDLPPLPVDAPEEPPGHLRAIAASRLAPGAAVVQGDERQADAELLAAEPVVVLGVVGGVGQEPVEMDALGRLPHGRGEVRGVVARAPAREAAGQKVRLRVADQRELRPRGPAPQAAASVQVVEARLAALQARRVDRRLGPLVDEPQPAGPQEGGSKEGVESPFFSSRCCA
jgi:hypothetical protein